jgi:ribonuclease BN (tRNA processing enzyme)
MARHCIKVLGALSMGVLKPAILLLLAACFSHAETQRTQLVMLGTGTPNADPERSGPAVAVVVNGTAYLVDSGPGVVRRAAAAAETDHIDALQVPKLQTVFITHLHSDHTLGLPDLIFSPWVLGRKGPLHAYGPRGLKDMTDAIEKAWSKDIYVRTHGLEQANSSGYKVEVHEISPGIVYKDSNLTVTAFLVKHGSWDEALGYKFQTADRRIVISGDTSPTDAVVQACNGCDVLVHEVYNDAGPAATGKWKTYLSAFHTSTTDLGAMATKAHPKLLVLYHELFEGAPEQALIDQMKRSYSGKFVSARDLDVY